MQKVTEEINDTHYKLTPLGHTMECEKIKWFKLNNGRYDLIFGVSDETRLKQQNDHNALSSNIDIWRNR